MGFLNAKVSYPERRIRIALNYYFRYDLPTDLLEQFQEVVDVGGTHGLCDVALVLEVVLAGVGSTHPQSMERADLQPAAIALK